jgi:hypothetical protein
MKTLYAARSAWLSAGAETPFLRVTARIPEFLDDLPGRRCRKERAGRLFEFFPQHEGEFGFAGLGRIVEGRGFAATFGGAEEESLLGILG